MRHIQSEKITEEVRRLCIDSNIYIGDDIKHALDNAREQEQGLPCQIIDMLIDNTAIAEEKQVAICQDTGMAVVFVEVGQDVHIEGDLNSAINEGVRRGYEEGYLRKSVVEDPVRRKNTGDNTPAIIHYSIMPGDAFKLTVAPKGFGSENMSRLVMLTPSKGLEGVKQAVIDTVRLGGANPCPPVVVGVGVGGTMEKACMMAKEALLREVGESNADPFWAEVEQELLEKINNLGIGPAGFGGRTTALAVNINTFPTHIAGLPVAVNIGCHVTRHKSAEL